MQRNKNLITTAEKQRTIGVGEHIWVSKMIRVFLSSPYSHHDAATVAERARIAGDAAAWLWRQGYAAYSPIAHWHEISERNGLPSNANAWIGLNRREIIMSDAVAFLHIDGWHKSIGMAMERGWAKHMPKAIIEPREGSFRVVQGDLAPTRPQG